MPLRHMYPFKVVVGTTAPSFNSTANLTPQLLELQSSDLGRIWAGPTGRSVRLAEPTGGDYRVSFGSSLTAVAAGSSDSVVVLGGTIEVFHVQPTQTFISVHAIDASTASEVNITLGYGE